MKDPKKIDDESGNSLLMDIIPIEVKNTRIDFKPCE